MMLASALVLLTGVAYSQATVAWTADTTTKTAANVAAGEASGAWTTPAVAFSTLEEDATASMDTFSVWPLAGVYFATNCGSGWVDDTNTNVTGWGTLGVIGVTAENTAGTAHCSASSKSGTAASSKQYQCNSAGGVDITSYTTSDCSGTAASTVTKANTDGSKTTGSTAACVDGGLPFFDCAYEATFQWAFSTGQQTVTVTGQATTYARVEHTGSDGTCVQKIANNCYVDGSGSEMYFPSSSGTVYYVKWSAVQTCAGEPTSSYTITLGTCYDLSSTTILALNPFGSTSCAIDYSAPLCPTPSPTSTASEESGVLPMDELTGAALAVLMAAMGL